MNRQLRFFLALRLVVYAGIVLYLAGDFSFKGPLSRGIRAFQMPVAPQPANIVVAMVGDREITLGQVDNKMEEQRWRENKQGEDLSPLDAKIARYAALSFLIDDHLLEDEMDGQPVPEVSDEEIDARMNESLSRHPNENDLAKSLKRQGLADKAALRQRIATLIRQDKWIDERIAEALSSADSQGSSPGESNAPTVLTTEAFRENLRDAHVGRIRIFHHLLNPVAEPAER